MGRLFVLFQLTLIFPETTDLLPWENIRSDGGIPPLIRPRSRDPATAGLSGSHSSCRAAGLILSMSIDVQSTINGCGRSAFLIKSAQLPRIVRSFFLSS